MQNLEKDQQFKYPANPNDSDTSTDGSDQSTEIDTEFKIASRETEDDRHDVAEDSGIVLGNGEQRADGPTAFLSKRALGGWYGH